MFMERSARAYRDDMGYRDVNLKETTGRREWR